MTVTGGRATERVKRARRERAPDGNALARQRLRNFKQFLTEHDPVALAQLADDVPGTLASVAIIDVWFRRYAGELKKRRVQ
jgi:hypothetical protein